MAEYCRFLVVFLTVVSVVINREFAYECVLYNPRTIYYECVLYNSRTSIQLPTVPGVPIT